MKKVLKKIGKVVGIILAVLLLIGVLVYSFVLQYPKLKENPSVNKWYKITNKDMKSADGSQYKAFFKKGSENKVLIYFAGGGSNTDEYIAREKLFNYKVIEIDCLANLTMNMGGLATASDDNPFKNWTVIAFPCATGDFMSGTGEFKYKDKNGKEQTMIHHGYTNYTMIMNEVLEKANIDEPEAVLVTGYSAGGFAAELLADDIYSNYFPKAKSKNLLIDASLLINENWHSILTDVWHTPKSISDISTTDNLTLDFITYLKNKYGDNLNVLFDSSTRDGDLAKTQYYFDNGKMEVDEKIADVYQEILKENIQEFKEAGAYLFLWDGLKYYDDPRNMTMHTIIASPAVLIPFEEQNKSIAQWVADAIDGNLSDYGVELIDKKYD